MSARRNTLTAVLFLAGLFTAVVFLCLGILPQAPGFLEAAKPGRLSAPEFSKTELALPAAPALARPLTVRPVKNHLPTPLPDVGEAVDRFIDGAEPAINDLLDREHGFIQLYGGAQRLMLRRVVEDPEPKYTVVKLTDQVLTFANLEARQEDMTRRADEMAAFARRAEREYRTPLLYIQAPSKLDMAALPEGIPDYSDAEADQFLAGLEAAGVDTLDLRPVFRSAAEKDPEALGQLFFHTDHHWTPEGAFLGYQAICEALRSDYGFQIDDALTDPDSFERFTFAGQFLGSQGKRVGTLYAGTDDVEIWSPKFDTDFTYTVPLSGIERKGPFAVSLLFPERLAETGLYDTNPYTIYAGDDYLLSRALNHTDPDAPRVLILRDSFGCALTPFLALTTGELMAVDPRNFNGDQDDMMDYIDWLEPDLIIVMNTTSSLRVDELYPYLPSARAAALEAKAEEDKS